MYTDDRGLLQGTLELLILRSIRGRSDHGYGIANWIEESTADLLRVEEGSLYPALHRLEQKGLIESEWGLSENNRRAKFYSLTREGRDRLREKTASWERLVEAMSAALHRAEPSRLPSG